MTEEVPPWEQNPDEISYLVQHFSDPAGLVVAFFGGGFGAVLVCRNVGWGYCGFNTDKACVNIGRKRSKGSAGLIRGN